MAAIKVVAKNAGLRQVGGGCETGCLAAVMQGAPGEMPPPCKRPMKLGLRAALVPDRRPKPGGGRKPGAIQARFGGFCWIRLGLIGLG